MRRPALSGVLTGTLALAAMEAILTTAHGQRLPEIAAVPGRVARWFIDPTKPLIPDMRSEQTKQASAGLAAQYQQAAGLIRPGANPFIPAGTGSPVPMPRQPTISPII